MDTAAIPRPRGPAWFRTWGALLLYCLYALVSLGYQWALAIPEQLQSQSGTLSIEAVGKKRMTALTAGDGKTLFSCASSLGGHPDCLDAATRGDYIDKPARVEWYRQPVFPGVTLNKLVTLNVAGEDVITRPQTEARMARRTQIELWTHLGIGLLIFVVSFCFLRKSRSN